MTCGLVNDDGRYACTLVGSEQCGECDHADVLGMPCLVKRPGRCNWCGSRCGLRTLVCGPCVRAAGLTAQKLADRVFSSLSDKTRDGFKLDDEEPES